MFFEKYFSNTLCNTLNYLYNNILSWKSSFKLNICPKGLGLISKHLRWSVLQQLKVVDYCCKVLHLQCLWQSWIRLCTSFSEALIKKVFHKLRFFHDKGRFSLSSKVFTSKDFFQDQGSFPWSRMSPKINKVFHIQKFDNDQESFPQKNIFPQLRKFSTSKDFFLIREVFHKKRLFHNQRSFPQGNIFFDQVRFPQEIIFSHFRVMQYLKSYAKII